MSIVMNLHEEIDDLVNGADPIVETETEPVTGEEFRETQAFLEGRRNCTVGGLVYNDDGELLLLRHAGEGWIQPGGMVERGESLETALEREIREETGVETAIDGPFFVRRGEYTHDGKKLTCYSTLFFAEAIDPSIADELGIEDEEIVDARWFSELPDELHELASRERFQKAMQEVDSRVS